MRRYLSLTIGFTTITSLLAFGVLGCGGADSPDLMQSLTEANAQIAGPSATPAPVDPSGPSNGVFDYTVVHEYRLTITPEDASALAEAARSDAQRLHTGQPTSNGYISAHLTVDGKQMGEIGIRHKGSHGTLGNCFERGTLRQICSKLSLKFKFDFVEKSRRLAGLKKLNLHSMSQDATLMRETLGYRAFRESGIPAPRSAHAAVYVNGEYKGVFASTENIDGVFVKERWGKGEDGLLYKEVWPNSEDPLAYQSKLETHEDDDPPPSHDKLIRWTQELGQSGTAAIIEKYMGSEYMMRYMAADSAMNNWDGVNRFYCSGTPDPNVPCNNHNLFLYVNPSQDRVWLIPWDLDGAWYVNHDFVNKAPKWNEIPLSCSARYEVWGGYHMPAACDPLVRGLIDVGPQAYGQAATKLKAGPLSAANLQANIDRWQSQLEGSVRRDPGVDFTAWQNAVTQLRTDMVVVENARQRPGKPDEH